MTSQTHAAPVRDDEGRVIAGLAASGAAIGPFVDFPRAGMDDPPPVVGQRERAWALELADRAIAEAAAARDAVGP